MSDLLSDLPPLVPGFAGNVSIPPLPPSLGMPNQSAFQTPQRSVKTESSSDEEPENDKGQRLCIWLRLMDFEKLHGCR